MSALDELLEQGRMLYSDECQAKANKEAEKKAEKEVALNLCKSEAFHLLYEHLGTNLADELPVLPFDLYVNDFHSPPLATLKLKYEMQFKVWGNRVSLERNGGSLIFPCESKQLAAFVFAAKRGCDEKAEEQWKAAKARVQMAIEIIKEGGRKYTSSWGETWWTLPQQEYNSAIAISWLSDYPDLSAQLEQAWADWRKREDERKVAEAQAEAHRQDVQSKCFYDFTVWCVTFVAKADDTEDGIYEDFAYSIAPEPDADGWWPIVRKGKVTLTRFPNYLKVEEVQVKSWEDTLATQLCAKVEIDGAQVLCPPSDAVMAQEA